MVKPLCSFIVRQIVTLRDVGFSRSKIQKQLTLKWRFSAQYAYKRYLKNNHFEAKKWSVRPPKLSKKWEKKLVFDVLKDPKKTSLEHIRVAHNTFSWYDSISRGTVRWILKKILNFFKKCCKKSFWSRKAGVFVQNCLSICSKSSAFYWWNKGANETRFLEKNTKNLRSDKRSLMFLCAIRPVGRKLLVKCQNKLNAVGYL